MIKTYVYGRTLTSAIQADHQYGASIEFIVLNLNRPPPRH